MERFGDGLKTARQTALSRAQKLLATVVNTPTTLVPMVTNTEKAAIEMKAAIIAYSIAVAPFWSSFISPSLKFIAGRSRHLEDPMMAHQTLTISEP